MKKLTVFLILLASVAQSAPLKITCIQPDGSPLLTLEAKDSSLDGRTSDGNWKLKDSAVGSKTIYVGVEDAEVSLKYLYLTFYKGSEHVFYRQITLVDGGHIGSLYDGEGKIGTCKY